MSSAAAADARPAAGRGRRGRVLARLLLLALSSALALAVLELGLRRLRPPWDPSGDLRFVAAPGLPPLGPRGATLRQVKNTGDFDVAVRFNALGLRDGKDLARSAPGDLFVVGDSFAFGWGVAEQDRFSNRLEALLGRPVYNLAMPGNLYTYRQLLDYARGHGARVDRLILTLTMENDVLDYADPGRRPPSPGPARRLLEAVKARLTGGSAVYRLATTLVHRDPALETVAARVGLVAPNRDGPGRRQPTAAAVAATADRVAAIARRCPTLVLIVPSRGLWLEPFRASEERTHRAVVAALRERRLAVVDPRARMEASGQPLLCHFADDGHWSPLGHRLAAAVLAEAVGTWTAPAPAP
jgi:hypothetical protein